MDNTALRRGGAIYAYYSFLQFGTTFLLFYQNRALSGGAISIFSFVTLTISGFLIFLKNEAYHNGRAIESNLNAIINLPNGKKKTIFEQKFSNRRWWRNG